MPHRVALALTSIFTAVFSSTWWNRIPPLGDDASSHIVLMARVSQALRTGAGWWAPDFNLGFPIGLYYQPLPHTIGGLVTWMLGGGTSAIVAYKLLSILLVALLPFTVAHGARRMGLSAAAATAAGVVSPLITSTLDFGLTIRSGLILALHTQAWAGVWLPLALGELARTLEGDRRAAGWAVGSWSFLFLSHFFYGIAVVAVSFVWVFCRPRDLLRRLGRLMLVGTATLLTLLFWFIPLATTLPSMGGWPFGDDTRVHGYGWSGFFRPLLQGHLLDGDVGLPVLSLLAAAGFVWCLVRARHSIPARLVVITASLATLLSVGRAGLGSSVDLFFLNRAVQMFRYLGVFHLSSIWLIGWALGETLNSTERSKRWWVRFASLLLLLALLVSPVLRTAGELRTAFRTVADVGVDLEQYQRLSSAIDEQTREHGSGRIFVHRRSGLYGHFHSALLALWSASHGGESYGVGLHDSLNFYFLEFFHPELDRNPSFVDLYGFQYIAADDQEDFTNVGGEVVFTSNDYTLWRVDHRIALCGPIDVESRRVDYPRRARQSILQWLAGNGPAAAVHPLLVIPSGLAFGGVIRGPVRVEGAYQVEVPEGEPGRLSYVSSSSDWVACQVQMNRPGALLFKIGFHPFWRPRVDGSPVSLAYAFPAFAAVELPAGEHEVVMRYHWPPYSVWLLVVAPIWGVSLWWYGRRERPLRGAQGHERRV